MDTWQPAMMATIVDKGGLLYLRRIFQCGYTAIPKQCDTSGTDIVMMSVRSVVRCALMFFGVRIDRYTGSHSGEG